MSGAIVSSRTGKKDKRSENLIGTSALNISYRIQKFPVRVLHINKVGSMASEAPIFFKVKWFLGNTSA